MTRKDFELIARVLRAAPDHCGHSCSYLKHDLPIEFAQVLGAAYPNFDADRFLAAATDATYDEAWCGR